MVDDAEKIVVEPGVNVVSGDVGKNKLLNGESVCDVVPAVSAVTEAGEIGLFMEGLDGETGLTPVVDAGDRETVLAVVVGVATFDDVALGGSIKDEPPCELLPRLMLPDIPGVNNESPVVIDTADSCDVNPAEFVENVATPLNIPTRLRLADITSRAAYSTPSIRLYIVQLFWV